MFSRRRHCVSWEQTTESCSNDISRLKKTKKKNSWCLNLKSSCLGWSGTYSENSMLLYAHYAVRTGLNWKYSDEILIALVLKEPLSWSPQKNSGYKSEILLSSQSSIAIHCELEFASFFSGGTTSNYSRPVNCAKRGRSLEKKLRLGESLCRWAPAFETGQQVTTSHVLIFLTDHGFLKRNCLFSEKGFSSNQSTSHRWNN